MERGINIHSCRPWIAMWLAWCFTVVVASMIVPAPQEMIVTRRNNNSWQLSRGTSSWNVLQGPSLLVAMEENQSNNNNKKNNDWSGFEKDQVVRILDANTIKLKKNGLVTLAGVRMPTPGSSGNFHFPECISYTPAYKLRQLLPSNSQVLVKLASSTTTTRGGSGKLSPAILVKSEDGVVVNQELVRTGFGKVQKLSKNANLLEESLDVSLLQRLQDHAQREGLGIFQRCDSGDENTSFEAQFEPLEVTAEIKWGDDGGKLVLRQREGEVTKPTNPGDVKGCSDFSTYEDALRWYESYFPYYGDVAKLDRDGDGVPCPGLPHTKVSEIYRMKKPLSVKDVNKE